MIFRRPDNDVRPGIPAAYSLCYRLAPGDVAEQHACAKEAPQTLVVEGAQYDRLDEGEIKPSASQLGVQELHLGQRRYVAAGHTVHVDGGIEQRLQGAAQGDHRLYRR